MQPEVLSTAHLDYLQRVGMSPETLSADKPISLLGAPRNLNLRRLVKIEGIGRLEKAPLAETSNRQPANKERPIRLLSEDVLTGLYSYKLPLAFLVRSNWGKVA